MQLGMIGLGRMGGPMVLRLMRSGHACVVFDARADAAEALTRHGATAARSLAEFALCLAPPRLVWLMLRPTDNSTFIKSSASRFAAAAGGVKPSEMQA